MEGMYRTAVLGSTVCALVFLIFTSPTEKAHAATCPSGTRVATAEDRRRAAVFGAEIAQNQECLDPQIAKWLDEGADKNVEYLMQRVCPKKTAGIPSDFDPKNTSPQNWNRIRKSDGYVYLAAGNVGMNPGAIKCFRQFFEEAEKEGLKPCVNAGLRSPAHQRASCLAPNSVVCGRRGRGASSCAKDLNEYTNCPHVRGIAIDVNENTGKLSELLSLARKFSGFTKVGAGAADPWHIEAGNCTDEKFIANQSTNDNWSPGPESQKRPSLAEAYRKWTDQEEQPYKQAPLPAQPAIPPQPAMPPQTMGQSQQPTQYFQPSPQGSTQPSPAAQPGTPVGTPSSLGSLIGSSEGGSSPAPVGIAAGTASSDNPEEEFRDRGPSIGDQLLMLAYGTSSTGIATNIATSVPIVVSKKEAKSLTSGPSRTASSTRTSTTTRLAATTTRPTQTFISGDITYGKSGSTIESRSDILVFLAELKARLLRALEILRPFALTAEVENIDQY